MDQDTKQRTLQKLRHDAYADLLGIEVVDLEPGYSLVSMTVRDDMLSFHNLPHPGRRRLWRSCQLPWSHFGGLEHGDKLLKDG